MRRKAETKWVVVADGAQARILVNRGPGTGLSLLEEYQSEAGRVPTRELGTERPGRTFERASATRHAKEPPADWHDMEKLKFARQIVDRLHAARENNEFQRLVLIAPPKVLGTFRKHINGPVRQALLAEIDKDLTNVPVHDLPRHLDDVMLL